MRRETGAAVGVCSTHPDVELQPVARPDGSTTLAACPKCKDSREVATVADPVPSPDREQGTPQPDPSDDPIDTTEE